MDVRKAGYTNTDEYIAMFSSETQQLLRQMRATIHAAAPEATEKISYQIPTFYLKGNLVHFAAFKHHISFFPTSSGIAAFAGELSAYVYSKGGVRLPKDKPLPLELISRIVQFRVAENLERAELKSRKK